ncbi:uncharacterized protein BJ171DRAFT_510885 [Polychytrium aggregatum]|uniref:uncharacterized protein n=1 Tax=Polychytrium aggregatum TaxID=110093 RepID=UPI0022FDFBE6|nr:uncharacterized protein BJ171DRAFT_510885 [Polychytrium aggregatum]KAI9203100.1 hypothetical protein BJ171DRAFT_510885 [Polychytrium aggregatum]
MDREEKIRLAKKKLNKFQKSKTSAKSDVADAAPEDTRVSPTSFPAPEAVSAAPTLPLAPKEHTSPVALPKARPNTAGVLLSGLFSTVSEVAGDIYSTAQHSLSDMRGPAQPRSTPATSPRAAPDLFQEHTPHSDARFFDDIAEHTNPEYFTETNGLQPFQPFESRRSPTTQAILSPRTRPSLSSAGSPNPPSILSPKASRPRVVESVSLMSPLSPSRLPIDHVAESAASLQTIKNPTSPRSGATAYPISALNASDALMDTIARENGILIEQKKVMEIEIFKLRGALDQAHSVNEALQRDLNDERYINQQNLAALQELDDLRNQLSDLFTENTMLQDQLHVISASRTESQNRIALQDRELHQCYTRIRDLEQHYTSIVAEKTALSEQLRVKSRDLDQLLKEKASQNTKIEAIANDLSSRGKEWSPEEAGMLNQSVATELERRHQLNHLAESKSTTQLLNVIVALTNSNVQLGKRLEEVHKARPSYLPLTALSDSVAPESDPTRPYDSFPTPNSYPSSHAAHMGVQQPATLSIRPTVAGGSDRGDRVLAPTFPMTASSVRKPLAPEEPLDPRQLFTESQGDYNLLLGSADALSSYPPSGYSRYP